MSAATKSKRGPKPILRDKIVTRLDVKKQATSADLKASTAYLTTLEEQGYVRVVGLLSTGTRGRKKNVYALGSKGRGRARSLANKKAQRSSKDTIAA